MTPAMKAGDSRPNMFTTLESESVQDHGENNDQSEAVI